ncbi:alpha-galactosidase [Cordyceps fumosorosea ARSEF 2679]|uniref:Alpha-galactosidase n=1 Tax=Cordyceps fumosorosea (strain ARSEF 2679) TaxID=1081104 RepID=A0A167P9I9_CORFA|nr:alpha-galactosidase [Cordyceps fumosorosea ARSEF 2679]OAA56428.1 alpha-galactosidase [Cordyceps fumosorosea ARSEF 2679]
MPATKRALGRTTDHPSTTSSPSPAMTSATRRTSPFLPTPVERLALGLFPALLVFGSLFALLSPDTRAMTYDAASQSHRAADGSAAPSYFARKSNLFNVYFVKRGWAWTSRPPLIDRGFRWTGGQCELAERELAAAGSGGSTVEAVFTAVACKASGGSWRGGHDISGHVFLLTLGSAMLMHEVLWPLARWAGWLAEERCVVMNDGAVKGAGVEAEAGTARAAAGNPLLGYAGKFALGVLVLNLWMLLMTAIYFHTWFEKLTGLLTAYVAIYAVYYVPRFLPALRQVIGVPGI